MVTELPVCITAQDVRVRVGLLCLCWCQTVRGKHTRFTPEFTNTICDGRSQTPPERAANKRVALPSQTYFFLSFNVWVCVKVKKTNKQNKQKKACLSFFAALFCLAEHVLEICNPSES